MINYFALIIKVFQQSHCISGAVLANRLLINIIH